MFSRQFQLFARNRKSDVRRSRRLGRFEQLEVRDLMHGSGVELDDCHALRSVGANHPGEYVAYDGAVGNRGSGASAGLGSFIDIGRLPNISPTKPVDPRAQDQRAGLPLLHSNPGAPVTLYLDFNGNFISDWFFNENGSAVHYYNVQTPAFSLDADATKFNPEEQNLIREIWARVAEDFSPFNINVSTAYYGALNNGQALKVNIGGNNSDWLNSNASGIASIGSFTDNAPNEVFSFDLAAWARAGVTDGEGKALNPAAAIATTASHEAGHAFGLRHRALYNANGTRISNYDPGTSDWTPIMGDNKASDRTTWDIGPTDQGANVIQDDAMVLAQPSNGFGFRKDDHGGTRSIATSLVSDAFGKYTGKGIIEKRADLDFFKFTTGGGPVTINVNGATFGANLVPGADLFSSTGYVGSATSVGWTQSVLTANLPAGTYWLRIYSAGNRGSMGQYTLSVLPRSNPTEPILIGPTVNTAIAPITSTNPSLLATSTLTSAVTTLGGFGSGTGMTSKSQSIEVIDAKSAMATKTAAAHDAIFGQWDESLADHWCLAVKRA